MLPGRMKNGHVPNGDNLLKLIAWLGDDPLAVALASRARAAANPDLRQILSRLSRVAESLIGCEDPLVPDDEGGHCATCFVQLATEEHDADCAWQIVRTELVPADLAAVRRLARALGYERSTA